MKKKINIRIAGKIISIYLDTKKDTELIKWISKLDDSSTAIRAILSNYLTGDLITKAEYLKQEELLSTRIAKMKAEIEYTKVKTRIALVHDLHVEPDDVIAIMDGKKTLDEVIHPIENDESKFKTDMALTYFNISNHKYVTGTKVCYCTICKNTFEWSDTIYKIECLRHVSAIHTEQALK